MDIIYNISFGLSNGIIIGFLLGGCKILYNKRNNRILDASLRLKNDLAGLLKYITFLLLSLGLIWCLYFLLLGILEPSRADYANNMSELIVSLLTVISIIFAFVEFLRRDSH